MFGCEKGAVLISGCHKGDVWSGNVGDENGQRQKLDVMEWNAESSETKVGRLKEWGTELLWQKRWVIRWIARFWCNSYMWSVCVVSGWLKEGTILRYRVKWIDAGLTRGCRTKTNWRLMRSHWSWETRRWRAWLGSSGWTLWTVRVAVWTC